MYLLLHEKIICSHLEGHLLIYRVILKGGTELVVDLMCVCPCIVDDMKKEMQLDATQWFIEFTIRSTCFGHYFAYHHELETVQMITACGT